MRNHNFLTLRKKFSFWFFFCSLVAVLIFLCISTRKKPKAAKKPVEFQGRDKQVGERYWNDCADLKDAVAGRHDDWCTEDLQKAGFEGQWRHVSFAKAGCPKDQGRGICKPVSISPKEMSYFEAEAHFMMHQASNRFPALDEEALDVLLRGKLALLSEILVLLEGSVDVINIEDGLLGHLAECLYWKKLNFFTDQHSVELWLPFLLKNHEGNRKFVRDPNTAKSSRILVFVSSFYFVRTVCHGDETTPERFDFADQHSEVVAKSVVGSRLWNSSNGFDYILPATHPLMPPSSIHYSNIIDMLARATFLCVDFDAFARYPKDIVVPYFTKERDSQNRERKRLLMSSITPRKLLRLLILEKYSNASLGEVFMSSSHLPSIDYDDLLATTLFCMMPRGDSTSSARFFDVVSAGCIPVVVSDWIYLPFQQFIDYSTFVVFVRESDVLENPSAFLDKLRSIPPDTINSIQKFMKQAKHLLRYDSNYKLNPLALIFIEAFLRRLCYRSYLDHLFPSKLVESYCKSFRI